MDHWYKRAVLYEVLVRSFSDSNGDGVGDFAGLTSKLDYLAWLGVDCVWLPPFFPSPLQDGGYDVADYCGVLPELGTLDDFAKFVAAARGRHMKVIIDFVMNHTSSAHSWFQASRTDPTGPYGDYYVWADSPDAYADARVIFLDTEVSNWTFDEVRGQYYWHRFFQHQPDLNFDNPEVLAEMLNAMRFWLDRGVDGFRLDAVPYLVEEEGTTCESLPGTHKIIREVRAMVDAEYPGRILLCEANQPLQEVMEYFGDGDECQMAFQFPVMPRLYMALQEASRVAVSPILAGTSQIPAGCQWATFLRNHDELTLEMVTPAERDQMWGTYAPEARMRSNLGIRRRLATLLDGDLRRIRLLHALLLSLPGSPVLYYGDEIGMGDEIWLNDRDGLRTPMQWEPGPKAGFSSADPDDFFLPVVTLGGYTPDEVNVNGQSSDPASLLLWLRAMLHQRRSHPSLATGDYVDLGGDNEAVLAFARVGEGRVIVLANLSDAEQAVAVAGLPARVRCLASGPDEDTVGSFVNPAGLVLPPYGYRWLLVADDT